jgi:putative peptide modification system cyclase
MPDTLSPQEDHAVAMLRALALADLVDSTALVERLGDANAAEILRQHDRLARRLIHQHGGQEIDKTDGFLAVFERPAQAVAFAIAYQRALRELADDVGLQLRARVGIHFGEVVAWNNAAEDVARGAKPVEVEGLAKPIAARLMSLALPGQILMSATAYILAHRAREEIDSESFEAQWQCHGEYRLKGIPEPVAVHEVGESGIAPFRAPAPSGKARRVLPLWRRPLVLLAESAVALAIMSLLAWDYLSPSQAIAFAERDFLIVAPLDNLTGDSVFDRSIEQVIRQGLEQTPFINVLSDVQVRDALRRMRHEPNVELDPSLVAEIAQREGARAIIRPRLMGSSQGTLKLSIEVLPPDGERTVMQLTSDTPVDSLLPEIDRLIGELRRSLGESLASLESHSKPLLRVTTGNLEALRAYSLSHDAWVRGEFDSSIRLIKHALKLDPEFAMAHARLGTYYYSTQQPGRARPYLLRALELSDRLVERERLYVEAASSMYGPPSKAAEAWGLLGALYPELGTGQHNQAYILYQQLDRCEEALPLFKQAAATRAQQNFVAAHFAGLCALRLERLEEAEKSFRESLMLGDGNPLIFGHADLMSVRGDHKGALGLLAGELPRAPYLRFAALQRKTAALVDGGNLAEALDHVDQVIEEASTADPAAWARARAARLALLWALGAPELRQEIELALAHAGPSLESVSTQSDLTPFSLTVSAGLVAARSGHLDLADRAAKAAFESGIWRELPVRAAHLQVLMTALGRCGHPFEANGLELEVSGAQGGIRLLQQEWEQLLIGSPGAADLKRFAALRGRAFAEWNEQQIEQPMNILLLMRARMAAAEIECADGSQMQCTDIEEAVLSPRTRAALRDGSPFRQKLHIPDEREASLPPAL